MITIQAIIRVAVGKSSMHVKEVAVEATAASERAQLTPPVTMQAEEVAVEVVAEKEGVHGERKPMWMKVCGISLPAPYRIFLVTHGVQVCPLYKLSQVRVLTLDRLLLGGFVGRTSPMGMHLFCMVHHMCAKV